MRVRAGPDIRGEADLYRHHLNHLEAYDFGQSTPWPVLFGGFGSQAIERESLVLGQQGARCGV
jgi:hypothetical protein